MGKKQKMALVALVVVLGVVGVFCGLGWRLAQQDLNSAMIELAKVQDASESGNDELSETEEELLTIRVELEDTKNYLSGVEAELQTTKEHLADVEAEMEDTKARLLAIQTDAFHLHNPTFEETISFLEEDKTDSNEYLEDEYVCSHFAADVNNNAESQGIRCALVDIRFPRSGHAIIAFDTTDEGLVYFDPVSDERVRPAIGKDYWRCIEPRPGYHYAEPSFDDTIVDIVVIW